MESHQYHKQSRAQSYPNSIPESGSSNQGRRSMLESGGSGSGAGHDGESEGENEESSSSSSSSVTSSPPDRFASNISPQQGFNSTPSGILEDFGRLEEFRQQWLVEISKKRKHVKYEFRQHLNPPTNVTGGPHSRSSPVPYFTPTPPNSTDTSVLELAKELYRLGLRAERAGALTQAVQCYRQAMQLVPDIETLCTPASLQTTPGVMPSSAEAQDMSASRRESTDTTPGSGVESSSMSAEEKLHLPRAPCSLSYWPPQPQDEAAAATGTHISQLPAEVLLMVFRWLVGSHLDVRQLEVLSEVCRGFHTLARDSYLWRMICRARWGLDGTLDLHGSPYSSWRDMAILRPHVHLDGCYLARASYVRHGEPTVGQVYHACYLVEYYRVMRFLPDGRVYFLTSTAEPAVLVKLMTQLGNSTTSVSTVLQGSAAMAGHGLLVGQYRVVDNHLLFVLKRHKDENSTNRRLVTTTTTRRGVVGRAQEACKQTFHLELHIKHASHRLHGKLTWKHYSLLTMYKPSNQETVTEFDISSSQYQPFVFSRVKSFTASVADEPLPYV